MKFKIITISNFDPDAVSMISEYLNILDNMGIWEKENQFEVYANEETDDNEIISFMENMKRDLNVAFDVNITEGTDDDIDWNSEWKKSYRPVEITDNIKIYPSWFSIPEEDKHPYKIKIDPQMGFGTGTHETTQMMLVFLEKYLSGKNNLLDMGTGSGILAIAAKKMKSEISIDAVEIDEMALENAKINEELNNVSGINWIPGDKEQIPEARYDLILANINRTILVSMFKAFKAHTTAGGLWILSGLLKEEASLIDQVVQDYSLEKIDEMTKGDWLCQAWKNME